MTFASLAGTPHLPIAVGETGTRGLGRGAAGFSGGHEWLPSLSPKECAICDWPATPDSIRHQGVMKRNCCPKGGRVPAACLGVCEA